MRVEVRPLNVKGRPLFKDEYVKRDTYSGRLRVLENRVHKLGRVVTTAKVVSTTDDVESTLLEMYDVALLWLDDETLRLRGFEEVDGFQHAQTWDVRVL